jgi:acyl-coenzyme A thioesterase PaaI-like protein
MSLHFSPPIPLAATPPDEDGRPSRLVAELNPGCVVCGHLNPHGMQLTFTAEADGVAAKWIPGKAWESFHGIVHGGVISTVLDEAMSKAIIANGMEAFTVELRVRFKQKLHTGETVLVRGWMVQQQKRRITAEASLCSGSGQEHAHAWGVFLVPPRSSVPAVVPLDTLLE